MNSDAATLSAADLPPWIGVASLVVLLLVVGAWIYFGERVRRGKDVVSLRRRRRVPWGADGALLAGMYVILGLLNIASQSLSTPGADAPAATMQLDFGAVIAQFAVLGSLTATAVVVLLVRHQFPGLTWGDFGLGGPPRQKLGDAALGVLGCAGMLPLVYAVNYSLIQVFGEPTLHPGIQQLMSDPSAAQVASMALLATVMAPLFEELAFRVMLQGGLERVAGRRAWWPIAVSSLAFGLAHTDQGFAPLPITVLAIGLGYLYRQTHSYVAVVTLHMAFNALSLAAAIAASQAGVEL